MVSPWIKVTTKKSYWYFLIFYIDLFVTRNGKGTEEFGNTVGYEFICPMNNFHIGQAYCRYTGNYVNGFFHGYGEFQCCTGQWYKGQWKQGKKNGDVS
jgi:hypothetical protein